MVKRKKLKRVSSSYLIIKSDLDVRLKLSNIGGLKSFSKDKGGLGPYLGTSCTLMGPKYPNGVLGNV